MKPKIIKINRIEDIALLLTAKDFSQIEIYLKNVTIPIPKINGNLYVRASGCEFPNLKYISGNLSIDAKSVFFPNLVTVIGDCNVHEKDCLLSELKFVGGNLKVLTDFHFSKLEKVGGKILKEGNIGFPLIFKLNSTVLIKNQKDADLLPEDGIFNLEIVQDNIIIKNEEIKGSLTIKANNVNFPNLISLKGRLVVGHTNHYREEDLFRNINFPLLEKITSNCTINAQDVNLDKLIKIGGKLTIYKGKIDFKNLVYVKKLHFYHQNNSLFKNLEVIDGDFSDNTSNLPGLVAPNLKFIKGDCLSQKLDAPMLIKIGGNITFGYDNWIKAPCLEYIGGSANFEANASLKNIKYIYLPFFNGYLHNLENLELVEHLLYENESFNTQKYNVCNYHFKVNETMYLSSKFCSISRFNLSNALQNKISINQFISILKMRHLSFQNFKTREIKGTWQFFESEEYQKIINKIEKHWNRVTPMTFENFFKIENRTIRLFCFNYVGVGTLMEKLGAKRINTQGIELDYFKYDENGNKIKYKKHNIFEVYQAERNKLADLRSWNNEKIYAVKCWCSSTDKEHWLWVEPQYANDPLTAIASTFRVHENIIPYIKTLKRQGDILICEMKTDILPEGNIRPLTKNEYFGLLEVES